MAQLRAGSVGRFSGKAAWLPMLVVVFGVVAGVGVLLYTQGRSRQMAIAGATAEAKPWELVGPACPQGYSGPWANAEYAPKKAFVFNGLRFVRRAGHVECSAIAAKGGKTDFVPMCQFTGPILVEVTTEQGTFKFQPGVGQPATVSVVDGQARCVMAGHAFE